MQLKKGFTYYNKTATYLAPVLNSFGTEFALQYQRVAGSVLVYAIQDYLYNDAKKTDSTESVLFIVFDKCGKFDTKRGEYDNPERGRKTFNLFLKYAKTHPNYFDSYIFDNPLNNTQHCIAFYIGKLWHNAYSNFTRSAYSEMYSEQDLLKCKIFPTFGADNIRNEIYEVLTKSENYLDDFKVKLVEYFNLSDTSTLEGVVFDEYDIPINLEQETLNYK